MPWTPAVLLAAGAVCLAAGISGCASHTTGSPPPARSASAVVLPSSPAPAADPQTLARAAYLGMWQAYVAAARTADYQAPGLDHYAAGTAFSGPTHGLYEEHQQGAVSLGQPVFHPVVTVAKATGAGASASVTDCADSSHWLNYRDGKLVPGGDTQPRRIIAQLQPFNGTWKVTSLIVGKAGTC